MRNFFARGSRRRSPALPNPLNAAGSFYVQAAECMGCGAPENEAPALMDHDESGGCYFKAQPQGAGEVNDAIRAVWASCCGAVRYGGRERSILVRLGGMGRADSCDMGVDVSVTTRGFARLEVNADGPEIDERGLIEYLAEEDEIESAVFESGWGSFRRVWAKGLESINGGRGYSIVVEFRRVRPGWWVLSLLENEAAVLSTAIHMDRKLKEWSRLKEIRWYSEEELAEGGQGMMLPY